MKNTNRNRNLRGGMKNAVVFALALGVTMSLPITAMAETYNIDKGSIQVEATDEGRFVTQENNPEAQYYHETKETIITGSTNTHNLIIHAEEGQTAEVTLQNVEINKPFSRKAAVQTSGKGDVSIELDGNNELTGGTQRAGLEKGNSGTLCINDANNDGSLEAVGRVGGAGIGAEANQTVSHIEIKGGTVIATGDEGGAGIGGGCFGNGTDITISGGKVTATGGAGGAGIGGGEDGAASNVVIRGDAQVTAQGGDNSDRFGAAIGSGYLPSQGSANELDVDISGLYTTGSVTRLDRNGSLISEVKGTVNPPVQPEEPTEEPETPPQEEPTSAPETPTQPEEIQILDPAEISEVTSAAVIENVQSVSLPAAESPAVSATVPSAEHHEIRIASAVNGAVAVDRENAKPGETVIVMVTPFEGYILKGISVIRDDGQPVPVTEFGNGVFTFVMPQCHVTIHAEFVPAG